MRLLNVIVLGIAVSLAGCTSFKMAGLDLATVGQAISIARKSAANPITKNDLAEAELAADGIIKGLRAYKSSCMRGMVDTNCKSNVAAIQVYTRQIPPYRDQLRGFVKNNDQVNAVVVYNQLAALISNVQNTAARLGVKVGAQ